MNIAPRRLITLAAAPLAFGCADLPTMPAASDATRPALDVTPNVYVLNTQLRGIINPDIAPSPAWGHVQVKLSYDGAAGYRVEWKGRLFNPDNETYAAVTLFYGGPDALPVPGIAPIFTFFDGTSQSCGILSFGSQAITDEEHLPADVAQSVLLNPNLFGVVVESPDGPRVAGKFSLASPGTLVGFNPQPDPPGMVTSCTLEPTR
jgi:hypothetical protein